VLQTCLPFNFSFLLCIFAFGIESDLIDISCIYKDDINFHIVGSIYYCDVSQNLYLTSDESRTIGNIWGSHKYTTSTDDKVLGIRSKGNIIDYFPIGFEKKFRNLKLISFHFGRLKEIRQSDLRPFIYLEMCYLRDNDIQFLEDGLFEYNPELKYVSLENNKIKAVGFYVFAAPSQLKHLYMSSSFDQCIKRDVKDNRNEVNKLIEDIKRVCNADLVKYFQNDDFCEDIEDESINFD